ncbi:MAG: long-chain-acyl-CoA synthetase [Hyphomonadaceae bacterium]|nr:long-chain-acyl-CoA synthetase [Hyphomonadaceae bacterium]MBC6412569.1 long-chain-acyl-CoA synthetase [Hyphomonadaceae bacterium]
MGLIATIKRELHYLDGMRRMLGSVREVDAESNYLIADNIEQWVDKFGRNIAFIDDESHWTFDEFDAYANRVARWGLAQDLKPGDTVAVFVQNRLEYVALWFGLSKIGVVPALLNYQLTGPALAHCVNLSDAKYLIMDHELSGAWNTAKSNVEGAITVLSAFGDTRGFDSFDAALSDIPPHRPDRSRRDRIKAGEQCMKMFTSGTTGLPKAAKVTHVRAQNYMRGFGAAAKSGAQDRMIMVLPLYHATGGLCGVGAAISRGGSVIVRRKFSAGSFWDDAVHFRATMFMYVGELCRFLLSAPAHPKEREHNIRWIIGNGLRPEVWPGFVQRFNIPHVIEFYGATEGNASLVNVDGPVGAVGRVPDYLKHRFNIDIIRYDVETNVNVRGLDGFCIRADFLEVGELIGEIRTDDARFRFDGYETKEATQNKILRDVFSKGDAWFRTGDLMKRDRLGYYYFMDRVGDTFRWMAENVATGEVAAVLSAFPGVTQANVYGVRVPGHDGRAGMASLVSEDEPDLVRLRDHLKAALPDYARPVFLRLSRETETTSTFKFKKINLVNAGYDPSKCAEPVYVMDSRKGEYIRIDRELFNRIDSGNYRL